MKRLAALLVEPHARYQYANVLHGIRLGVAVILALLVNIITRFPHGEWTTITVFIVLGLLQYQGAIYTKAKERVLGTVFGIIAGLCVLGLDYVTGSWTVVYYTSIGVVSALIGYAAVKQLGYIGLLTGITMMMIISGAQQNALGEDGVYRVLNVLIGTGVSVAATLILPLKSTLMWRFLLSSNLDACATLYAGVGDHVEQGELETSKPTNTPRLIKLRTRYSSGEDEIPVDRNLSQALARINKRLLTVRGHIAATANETKINKQTLEDIQRTHRNIIGTIDLLLQASPRLARTGIDEDNRVLLQHYQHELTHAMRHVAAVLRSPSEQEFRPITRILVADYPSVGQLSFEWQGYFWLTQTLQQQLQTLSDLLQESKPKWYAASGVRYQRREQQRIRRAGGESELDL